MLRTTLLASAALLVAAPALAADLPAYEPAPAYAAPVQGYSWSGGYVGAQAGYGWAKARNNNGTKNTNPDGAVLGAYAGYNHQFEGSPVVAGVETDLNWHDGSDGGRSGAVRAQNDIKWSGATRGRVGVAFDRVLVYGAGGVAYGEQKVKRRVGPVSGSDSNTMVGWTAGAGVEGAVTDNVTARIDYRYNDYGSDKYRTGAGGTKSELTENRLTAGVAYKFGSW